MQPNSPHSPYSFDSRYTLCAQCGAVLPVPIEGGAVTCGACGRAQTLGARDSRAVHQLSPHPITPEQQRVQAMRAQDGQPFQAPSGLQSLLVHGNIPDWKVKEAFAAWQSSRQELVATSSFDAAERLLYLSMFLPQSGEEMAPLQKRAFFESAVELMTIPRHRQLILGQLARSAAREGDVRAAEAWIALCDPAPDDLDMDTNYRASRAFIDTIQGRWENVVRVLGSGPDDIPIADHMDVFCGVLRANAWEKMGRIDVAVQLLDKELGRGASTVEGMLKKFPICEQSYAQASAQHDQASAEKVAHSAGGGIGNVLLMVGGSQVFIGFGLLAASAANYFGLISEFGPPGDLEAIGGPAFGGFMMMAVSVGLAIWGFKARKAAARARYIRLHGTPALAQIVNCGRTGTKINGVPQWNIQMSVQLPDKPPYEASTKLVLTDAVIANMQGKTLKVRVDPNKPTDVVLQLH
jgi:hypothetical protein